MEKNKISETEFYVGSEFHTDRCGWLFSKVGDFDLERAKYVLYQNKYYKIEEIEEMDEEDYNRTILANSSLCFSDLFEDGSIVKCVLLKEIDHIEELLPTREEIKVIKKSDYF